MGESHLQLSALLARVRTRWRARTALRAWAYGAAVAAATLALALLVDRLVQPEAGALVLIWVAAAAIALAVIGAVMAPLRHTPRDPQVDRKSVV